MNTDNKLKRLQQRLAAVVEASEDAIFEADRDGIITSWNPGSEWILGYSRSEIIGKAISVLFPRERMDELEAMFFLTGRVLKFQRHETEFLRKDGETIRVSVTVVPVFDEIEVVGFITVAQDISLEAQLEEALREEEERFRSAFEFAAIGMAVVTLDGRFSNVNPALCELVGYNDNELTQLKFHDITHPDDLEADLGQVRKLLNGEVRSYSMEKRYFHKQGQIIWVLLSVSLVQDRDGAPLYFISQIQDINKRKEFERELTEAKEDAEKSRGVAEKLAATDYLTGLMNRRAFVNRLDAELARSARDRTTVTVIMADIDNFKLFNDTFGHSIGDAVLKAFADALKASSRLYDFIGRHGGEEFVVGLPGTSEEEGLVVAERMRIAVSKCVVPVDDPSGPIGITGSFGVSACRGGGEGGCSDFLIRCADSAMYDAKRAGKNCIFFTREQDHCGDTSKIPNPNCYRKGRKP